MLYEDTAKLAREVVCFRVNKNNLLTSPGRLNASLMRLLARVATNDKDDRFSGKVSRNTIAMSGYSILEFVPSCVRRIVAMNKELFIRTPHMVFRYTRVDGDHRLTSWYCKSEDPWQDIDEPVLTPAQFLNTDPAGEICMGTTLSHLTWKDDPASAIEAILKVHFEGAFTEWRGEKNKELIGLMVKAVKSRAHDPTRTMWKHIITNTSKHTWTSPNKVFDGF